MLCFSCSSTKTNPVPKKNDNNSDQESIEEEKHKIALKTYGI